MAPAESEEQIFSATALEIDLLERPRPTTSYWNVRMELRVPKFGENDWVRSVVPVSDGRQAVLSRRIAAPGLQTRDLLEDGNVWIEWAGTEIEGEAADSIVQLEFVAEARDQVYDVPTGEFPVRKADSAMRRFLEPTEAIQSRDPAIRKRATEIVRGSEDLGQALWALYQYTAAFLERKAGGAGDAKSVLRNGGGSGAGHSRLLAAFLRSLGIPARMVGGLRLRDWHRTRSTIAWVEVWDGERWFPIDPGNSRFGYVPNAVLTLYRGDLPLIVHRRGLEIEWEFAVRQVTRQSVPGGGGDEGLPTFEAFVPIEDPAGPNRLRTIASYVSNPVATVAIVTDGEVPEALVDRLRVQAIARQLNLIILIARFDSAYLREDSLKQMVAENLGVIRHADVLLVSTSDVAGFYSLLELGERRIRMEDARIVVSGEVAGPVGGVLGAVLYDLLDPGELAIFSDPVDLRVLWEIGGGNLIHGTPIADGSRQWGLSPRLIDREAFDGLSSYRRTVVRGWSRAVRAKVPLEALSLILVLPAIALCVVVFRNVIGVTTFGLFSPVIVALAFHATGVTWGSAIFIAIVGLGALIRNGIQRFRLHLVARLSILVGLVALVMVGLTVVGASLGVGGLLRVSIFPMVIMANVIEDFTQAQLELGTREAIRLTANTLFVCIVSNWLVESTGMTALFLAFPEAIFIVLAGNAALGKWQGLRLLEYKRFYDLLRRAGEPAPETEKRG